MVNDTINLKTLNLDELNGVVSLYPWFAGARVELCRRMAAMGENGWDRSRYAEQALYVCSRSLVHSIWRESLEKKTVAEVAAPKPKPSRQVFVIGGDYFSQEQYETVKKDDDNIFASFLGNKQEVKLDSQPGAVPVMDFCTESLAKVYLEQGYPDKAREIYSKLSLRYPEKSVYFAALIENIDNQI